jgi:hypothetical protein
MFQNDTDRDSALSADDVSVSHDKPIDDTLLDIGKDFELNLNEIVTNVLRQKSNSLIDTLEEFSALDAEDFAAKVATRSHGWYRAVIAAQVSHGDALNAIDNLSEEVTVLEQDLQHQQSQSLKFEQAANRREIRLEECKKIIAQQQGAMALQQTNISELQARLASTTQQLADANRGRTRTRTPDLPRHDTALPRDRSWSPSQVLLNRNVGAPRDHVPVQLQRVSEAPSGATHNSRMTTTTTSSRSLRVPDPPKSLPRETTTTSRNTPNSTTYCHALEARCSSVSS